LMAIGSNPHLQSWQSPERILDRIHVAVVGAGIVGLAVAYHLVKNGARVTVIDRDPDGDKTSFGNAGGIAVTEVMPAAAPGILWRVCGWMLDPLGPIAVRPVHAPKLIPWLIRFARVSTPAETARIAGALAALNARVYEDLMPLLGDTGMTGDLHRKGALFLYETDTGYRQDAAEWACKRRHGIVVEDLTSSEARALEPALGPRIHRAVFTPQWSHVSDPRRLMQGLKSWLSSRDVLIRKNEVRAITAALPQASLQLENGERVAADAVVIAAGVWSGLLARGLGDRALLESEAGYNTTLTHPGVLVERELVFAERKFVATPLSCGLRIGGAAEFGGLDAAPNFERSRALGELARRYLPELRTDGGTSWRGLRPATPDSLPVIGPSRRHANIFYAFGHGHLGLTQAATTGKLIAELVFKRASSIDMQPYDIARFN
jgi:D-amino-acid dehydrogenase